ncbi:peptidoglycan D,D-transpeptidase FtsI family protein [Clostridiisalibacter paucivorans]|uniref:peptidoglycan D,D-transpeptidase FtsI family protein n=1 Tax=Clostridiisalibacter paucivorans TaxID=408753 RepID=UPI00047B4EDA|nr:penicillin-binding transpeptidase domain-containing protein [Clostridiisalibacter paucivorans]
MERERHTRIMIFINIFFLGYLFLVGKLFWIQIVKHREYQDEAMIQRNSEIRIYPARGVIFDRNLIPLTNRERHNTIFIIRDLVKNNDEVLNYLEKEFHIKRKSIINENKAVVEYAVNKDISNIERYPGVFTENIVERYSDDNILSHVIGYINESENRGETGLERVYNDILVSNSDYGKLIFQTDGKKRIIPGAGYLGTFKRDLRIPNGVKLTIDYHIQKIVEEIMDEKKINGAVIVTDAESGDILAMSSRPNLDVRNIESHMYSKYMDFYNKAIEVEYPPASIFKIVVLLAALEDPMIDINEDFFCSGYELVGDKKIKCHSYNSGGHGNITIREAFYHSCNSVFIQMGKKLGAKKIVEMAKRLGFGEKVQIELLEEKKGNLPKGDELLGPAYGNISIGQGKVEVTPLQINNLTMIIANNGIKKDLRLVDSIVNANGITIKEIFRDDDVRVIDGYYTYIVKKMMEGVVEKGTARNYISLEKFGGAAGKTGTAEAIMNEKAVKHGWFSGFFPKEKPKYVVTVLVEDGVSGGVSAAPIFNDIIKNIVNIQRRWTNP